MTDKKTFCNHPEEESAATYDRYLMIEAEERLQ